MSTDSQAPLLSKRTVAIAIVGLLFVGSALLVVVKRCGPPDDERTVILQLIETWAEAGREGDIKALRRALSPSYHDDAGRDRQAIDRFLVLQLLRRAKINALVVSKDVVLGAGKTTADAIVKIVLRRSSSVRALRMALSLRKEDASWRVTSASWRDINLEDVTKLGRELPSEP